MAEVRLFSSTSYSATGAAKSNIVVLDSKDVLQSAETRAQVARICGLTAQDMNMIDKSAARLTSNIDNGSSVEFLLDGGADLRRFVLVIPSTGYSRHNSPARPHTLGAVVKDVTRVEDSLYLLLSTRANAYAQACAIGRNFPLFNMKANAAQAKAVTMDIVVHFDGMTEADNNGIVSNIRVSVDNIRLAQRLVDMPPNLLHADSYVAECLEVQQQLGADKVSVKIIQGHDLEKQGFGGLWGVGKASEHLPALVVLTHVPEGCASNTPSFAMVGKGIVYDTGGLSIKVPPNMAGMKADMGGSAAVLGAFAAAVRSGSLTAPLHGLLCIAENAVGPLATRPDDIHTLLSGRTVEVNNTDAEGRLVLSDGCYYASKYLNPKIIIDIATLTGAQLITTGKKHGALYCNDDDLEAAAIKAGKFSGDLTFPIVYVPEFHKKEFASAVADMKNSVADRGNAQCSCAGQFIGNHIEEYTGNGGKWLHVDMAGPAKLGERATGYGVGLLFNIVTNGGL